MRSDRPRRSLRRVLLWGAIGSVAFVIVLLIAIVTWVPFSADLFRTRVIAALESGLDAEVELQDLHLRVFPRFHAEGFNLTLRHQKRRDIPPLISVRHFEIDADLIGLARKHVARLTLEGLDIEIPPDRSGPVATKHTDSDANTILSGRDVIVDRLIADDARLVIIPKNKNKVPRTWDIHHLQMRSVAFDRAMPFDATLTNAVPPGEIVTRGIFGPWHADEPGETPLEGTFTFADADLGVFDGIAGTLSAHGELGGTLERIGVHGETETPDFTIAISGHPVPLHTDYHATIDGTNGDTWLDRIDGKFLNTSLVAKGSVISGPGKEGRTVALDVEINNGRLEDVMRLAVKANKSPMIGALNLTTKLVLPPGHRDVVDKLRLDGKFSIATARFTSIDIQEKVNELSRRSRGKPEDAGRASVASNFNSRFRLADGKLALESLTFDTPGASVRLAGTYQLRPELLDFSGTLLMDAKVSETQTGLKRLLLKAVDPLFKKDGGGSRIPIRIEGKRSDPSFGLDKGRIFHHGQ